MTITTPFSILLVCLGNICRSPLAEGLLRNAAQRKDIDLTISSGGTGGWHVGNPPDPRSQAVAAAHGLDISQQRAHQVSVHDLKQYDLILAMDRNNLRDLKALAQNDAQRQKIHLFLEFAGLEDSDGPDVFDPYWDDSGFAGVYELIARAADRIVDRLTGN
ncbi:low molecular weight protein-tyrosine-phosphatase [Lewinella sp. W8]|uniref:low molecular weight protein-tyrosine-phosphatase n=1 Tax=Lewinella sp. W8 TaxID=2528208 RepID=UPI0010681A92|nr:low molecular weight protein-tyrosine-phosphatase [Lewinella sp. W8]MTB50556.1 low molecular weight phosphotyrosine protein phosphatase [Lewinella sp. W8]